MSSNRIPMFQMSDYYVYFKDLMNTENNAPWIARQKHALYHEAENHVNSTVRNLTEPEHINKAITFLKQVAANERDKELMAVKNYCRNLHKKYPSFMKDINEDDILEKPDDFYIKLTKYLNQAKQDARQYTQELKHIRENAGLIERTWKKKKRNEYSDDNYLFNLQNDIKSLLTKLNGTYYGKNKDADAYTNKVQAAAIQILNQYNIPKLLQNGDDFAAIASGVLIDLQQHLQAQFDEEREQEKIKHNEKIADVMKNEISSIVDKYMKEIEKGENLTSVQSALKDITSIRSNHVIQQLKDGLGIQLEGVEKLAKRVSEIDKIKEKTKHRTSAYRKMVNDVIGTITNPNLLDTLPRLTFTNFDKKTGHGNIKEVVSAAIQYNKDLGLFIKPQVGVDLMEFHIDYEIQDPTTESMIKIMKQIDGAFTAFERQTHNEDDSSLRDLEPAIHSLNIALQKANEQLDQLLHDVNAEEQFFVYHTSEKLHTSVETGKSLGFKGRDHLNILSGMDAIYVALQTAGLATPTMKDELHFIALNLAPSAVGSNALDPVTTYLSKFAGLLMFDDVENMAKEAMEQIQYTNLNVIHVYKLNNIYVPASMLLTYISDEIEKASQFALEDIAKVEINVDGAENTITSWLSNYHDGKIEYSRQEWRNVANDVASSTQIKITLMAAFLRFIEKLALS